MFISCSPKPRCTTNNLTIVNEMNVLPIKDDNRMWKNTHGKISAVGG